MKFFALSLITFSYSFALFASHGWIDCHNGDGTIVFKGGRQQQSVTLTLKEEVNGRDVKKQVTYSRKNKNMTFTKIEKLSEENLLESYNTCVKYVVKKTGEERYSFGDEITTKVARYKIILLNRIDDKKTDVTLPENTLHRSSDGKSVEDWMICREIQGGQGCYTNPDRLTIRYINE